MPSLDFFKRSVKSMAQGQLAPQGVTLKSVYEAFAATPRHFFLPAYQGHLAYTDAFIPVNDAGFLLPPATLGVCIEALNLQATDTLLYAGGCYGYEAAICSQLCRHVTILEKRLDYCASMKQRFHDLDLPRVKIMQTDDDAMHALYDVIIIAPGAFPHATPETRARQLNEGGRILHMQRTTSASVATMTVSTLSDGVLYHRDITHIYLPDIFRV